MGAISRLKTIQSGITVAAAVADSDPIMLDPVASAIYVPATLSVLKFYGSSNGRSDGTFSVIKRRTNADTDFSTWEDVTIDTGETAGWYPVPDECMPFACIKVTDSAETPADPAAEIILSGAT